jgi:hypothetical protein
MDTCGRRKSSTETKDIIVECDNPYATTWRRFSGMDNNNQLWSISICPHCWPKLWSQFNKAHHEILREYISKSL